MTDSFDVAIIGGGIVGMATAFRLSEKHSGLRLAVLEKESDVAAHQTGRNSGVLHSGIYYKPGSLKARNCRTGKAAMEQFCKAEGIPFDLCGKVIVATKREELPLLEKIYERGQANGVVCRKIRKAELDEIEPHTSGIAAIHVPEAGIVDYAAVTRRLAERVCERGNEVRTKAGVRAAHLDGSARVLETDGGEIRARFVVNCAGLHADRVAAMLGVKPEVQVVPFRGEYYFLRPEAAYLCRGLIYPVPDPNFPFLGVHFTRMIRGGVECGPNAVLGLAREGYSWREVSRRDLTETLRYGGFRKLAGRHWRTGLGEMHRSLSKRAFVRALQKLVPEVQAGDLEAAPAGVRAMAIGPDGMLVDDFLIQAQPGVVNVLNAPSPAATSALNVGALIVAELETLM